MKVALVRGEERVEIDGDDELICDSFTYQATFDRTVKKVTDDFYGSDTQEATCQT